MIWFIKSRSGSGKGNKAIKLLQCEKSHLSPACRSSKCFSRDVNFELLLFFRLLKVVYINVEMNSSKDEGMKLFMTNMIVLRKIRVVRTPSLSEAGKKKSTNVCYCIMLCAG